MGIRGRFAIVCAAPRGLGKACALALGREGVNLVVNARDVSALEPPAEEIRLAIGVDVAAVAADVAVLSRQVARHNVTINSHLSQTIRDRSIAGDSRRRCRAGRADAR